MREKVELVLRLKDMGRRFEWRGALKVFRRAKAGGMVPDNSVYRSVKQLLRQLQAGFFSQGNQIMFPPDEACTDQINLQAAFLRPLTLYSPQHLRRKKQASHQACDRLGARDIP